MPVDFYSASWDVIPVKSLSPFRTFTFDLGAVVQLDEESRGVTRGCGRVPEGLMSELTAWSEKLEVNGSRVLALVAGDAVLPVSLRSYVVSSLDGDHRAMIRSWLSQNALEALHQEYLDRSPVSPKKQQSAVAGWTKARRNVTAAEQGLRDGVVALRAELARRKVKLEEAVKAAKMVEYRASAEVVRTHGNGPVQIEGVSWDPHERGGQCYLVPRRRMNTTPVRGHEEES